MNTYLVSILGGIIGRDFLGLHLQIWSSQLAGKFPPAPDPCKINNIFYSVILFDSAMPVNKNNYARLQKSLFEWRAPHLLLVLVLHSLLTGSLTILKFRPTSLAQFSLPFTAKSVNNLTCIHKLDC